MGITIPTVNKACCFDLKTGAITLGVLQLILSILGAIVFIAIMFYYGYGHQYFEQKGFTDEEIKGLYTDQTMYIYLSIVIGISIFCIIIDSLLIHGARTGRAGFLTPWLVLNILTMVCLLVSIIISIISLNVLYLVVRLFILVIKGYFFVCVWSLRKEIQREKRGSNTWIDKVNLSSYFGENKVDTPPSLYAS